ncbi:unnamed protein product [Callosobruchus maculatus]|uniref:Uncharacterized protein n=1 Tax=Callosobruchus maculatus TaxID=64391 RepID=A0A653DA38_CALMS|nr:unnamed protein product [Callosobruchus maculatus]
MECNRCPKMAKKALQ